MTQNKASVMEKVDTKLFLPPHVGSELVGLITGDWNPNSSQQEQLVSHLFTCYECRATFIVLMYQLKENEQSHNGMEAIHTSLAKVVALHSTVEHQDDEQLAAYAETIYRKGQKVAHTQFPELAEHIEYCTYCQEIVNEVLTILKEDT